MFTQNSIRLLFSVLILSASNIVAQDRLDPDITSLIAQCNIPEKKNIKRGPDGLQFYVENPMSKKVLQALLAAGVPAMGVALLGAQGSKAEWEGFDNVFANVGLGVLGISGLIATIFGGIGLLTFDPGKAPVLILDKQGLQKMDTRVDWSSIKKVKIKTRTERIGRHGNFTYQYIQIRLKNGSIMEIGTGTIGLPLDKLLDAIHVFRNAITPKAPKS